MDVLSIKTYPDPFLRKKAKEINEVTPEIKELVFDMEKIMEENQGVGLAAPQVGVSKRIIIVRMENQPRVLINPKIFKKNREAEIAEEGCLSVPGVFLEIKRAKWVEIEALDIEGKAIYFKAEGLPARIFQHEIDHLDGILLIDRLSFLKRLKIIKKLKTELREAERR